MIILHKVRYVTVKDSAAGPEVGPRHEVLVVSESLSSDQAAGVVSARVGTELEPGQKVRVTDSVVMGRGDIRVMFEDAPGLSDEQIMDVCPGLPARLQFIVESAADDAVDAGDPLDDTVSLDDVADDEEEDNVH